MPFYDYHCEKCDKTLEIFQKLTDEPIKTCKYCSGKVRKVLSAPGIIFKGTGWHVSDYASEGRKKAMQAEKQNMESSSQKTACTSL